MADFKDSSRGSWTSGSTVEHINAGSLQRIADAAERQAKAVERISSWAVTLANLYKQQAKRERTKRLAAEKKLRASR